jgi:hypothetical protein
MPYRFVELPNMGVPKVVDTSMEARNVSPDGEGSFEGLSE